VLVFDTANISKTGIETKLKVLLDGGNTAIFPKSSFIQIEVEHDKKSEMPTFSEKVPDFTVLNESGKNFEYVSPKVSDPDNQLDKMTFKIEPELDCQCFKITQTKNQFKITLDMEKLEEKDAGEYSIEIEFFDQEKK